MVHLRAMDVYRTSARCEFFNRRRAPSSALAGSSGPVRHFRIDGDQDRTSQAAAPHPVHGAIGPGERRTRWLVGRPIPDLDPDLALQGDDLR